MVSIFSIRNFFVTAIAAVFACLLVTVPISPLTRTHTAAPVAEATVPMDVELTSIASDLSSLASIPAELATLSQNAANEFATSFNDLGTVMQGVMANFTIFSLFEPSFWNNLNTALDGWLVDLNNTATGLLHEMDPGALSLCTIIVQADTDITDLFHALNSDLAGFLNFSWL